MIFNLLKHSEMTFPSILQHHSAWFPEIHELRRHELYEIFTFGITNLICNVTHDLYHYLY